MQMNQPVKYQISRKKTEDMTSVSSVVAPALAGFKPET